MAPIRFGILMVPYQTIDVAGPLDVLSSCSKEYITQLEAQGLPGSSGLSSQAIDIEYFHINETLSPVKLTAGMTVVPSTTCDDCPPLDYLLIGGPDPSAYQLPERFARFIREHVAAGRGLFGTCTGPFILSQSGVLNGKTATTNHALLQAARMVRPEVNWVEKQWVVEGKIWTAGGACAGMDMMANWVMQNYGMEVARYGFAMLDYEPRDIDGGLVLPRQHGVATA